MTREELLSLPAGLALKLLTGFLADQGLDAYLASVEKPRVPRAPKWDQKIARKEGYQWTSETDLESLRYWCGKYRSGADAGTEWSERDRKNADKLSYWIAYREVFPSEPWAGERNNAVVTAAPPNRKPTVHPWGPRSGGAYAQSAATAAAEYHGPAAAEDEYMGDIPFAYCDACHEGERWWPW